VYNSAVSMILKPQLAPVCPCHHHMQWSVIHSLAYLASIAGDS